LTSKKPEADGDLQNSFTKTITYDVSERGCFIYSTADWCTGDSVWIFVKGLKDRSLIKGIVRRVVPWGTYMKVPGIGIEVDTINPGQQEEISRFIADFRDD
jgi:Tfp pilus assembly protein PilZ